MRECRRPARDQAFTSRNIRAGWTKAGLFPFNPDKVLVDIPKPLAGSTASEVNAVEVGSCTQDQVPQTSVTPVTPITADAVASLHNLIKQDALALDDTSRQRLQRHVQKLTNATQLSFAERALLQENNQFLAEINNEAKARRRTKPEILGVGRVVSYEDLQKARVERAVKDAEKAAKKAAKEAKRAAKATPTTEEADSSERKRGRKRKSAALVHGVSDKERQTKFLRTSATQVNLKEDIPQPYRAPEAKMY
ncbi:hypothetical protein BU23DRAFT_600650 [Bimuria novae-zelandiae CBS 107.79]|uniref:Uncharacterized protein n=1 Tax=Bimuria novae-zelandiae CBS 107.79 TaxID=1447943 RepID=A0A6A5V0I6_9PLEO|nr:hypothetical protein BU23DRAFT_600650 [Bimuria novae-zelandiae CBS 107.79]